MENNMLNSLSSIFKRSTCLNLKKEFFTLLLLFITTLLVLAQPTVLGTDVINGGYSTYNLTDKGAFRQVSLQATSSAATSVRKWEFATGSAGAANYSTNWRPYTTNNTLSLNTYIPTSFSNGAKYNTGFGGQSGLLPAITNGNYYTFNVGEISNADNVMTLLETAYNPVTISSVSQSPAAASVYSCNSVTITVTTSAAPSSGEYVYVRYSTNDFSTSSIVQLSFSGTTGTGTIPAQTGSTNVKYYVFSSNSTSATIGSNYDMFTLNLNNNSGSNYSYSVTSGTAPSITTQPTASAVCSGGNATFSVSATGTGLTYQWQKGGVNLTDGGVVSGATTSSLSLTGVTSADAANYSVVVSGTCTPSVTSNAVALTVNALPTASISATNSPVCSGNNAVFNLSGTTGATVTYNLNGGTNSTVILTGGTATVTASGVTANTVLNLVSVSDGSCSQNLSGNATVTVNSVPNAPTASATQTFCSADNPTVAQLTATGTSIKWYDAASNGNLLANSTSLTDATSYYASQTVNGCESSSRTAVSVTINAATSPSVSIAASETSICAGTTVTFTPTPTNGGSSPTYQWKKNGTDIATGNSYSPSNLADNDVITVVMTSSSSCASPTTATSNAITMTVNSIPNAPTATANQSFCSGNSPKVSDLVAMGTGIKWYDAATNGNLLASTTNLTNATSYYASQTVNGCESSSRTAVTATINTNPTILGNLNVCLASTTQLTGSGIAASSNPWTSGNTAIATVNNSGQVTGLAVGSTTITYTNEFNCSETVTVTVHAIPTISGTLNICVGSSTTLTGSGTAATSNPWVSSNTPVATVNNSGIVTGVSAGNSFITYTDNNACTKTVTVNVYNPPTVTGDLTVCAGSTVTLTGSGTAASSNAWVSATTSVATVNNSGVVTGVSAGTSIITYTDNTGCTASVTITVKAVPSITGTLSVCEGFTTVLTGSGTAASSNAWVSATPSVATVDNSGVVTGVSAGTSVVTYTDNTGCSKSVTITVGAAPSITGTLSVCAGSTTALTGSGTAASSNAWVSATPSVATVDNSGVVTGVSAGTSVITYTDNTGCSKSVTVTVKAVPTIMGTLNVCVGATTPLTGSGTAASSNAWVSATTSVATVDNSGVVTGVSAGTSVITYTDNNGCTATATVTVKANPTVTGTLNVCVGSTTTLTGSGTAASSNAWVSATPSVATVNNSGVVTGVSAGTSIITYTDNNGCTTTATVTVKAVPTITGTLSVCVGSTTALTGSGTAAASNAWVSATPSVATVDNSGVVTGVSAGTSIITYTDNMGCSQTVTVTVSTPSVGGSISGGTTVCSGTNSTTLTLSGHTGSIVKWQSSTTSDFSASISDITNTNTTYTATNLTTSTYYRAVVQSGACGSTNSSIADVLVSSVSTPTATVTDPSCTVATGAITVTSPTSGVEYSFDNGSTYQTSNTKTGLTANTTYQVRVRDITAGCISSATSRTINAQPSSPSISNVSFTAPSPSCSNGNGTITITAAGATLYSITGGASYLASNSFGSLSCGTYSVRVKNASGCETSYTNNPITFSNSASGSCALFMMQGFNYDFGKYGAGYNWADTLKDKAVCLGKAGFTHLWFPGHYGDGEMSSGYNPRDLYMGENTGLGTPTDVREMITALNNAGVDPVGDFIYNHRDGGKAEKNPAVEEYIQYRAGGSQKPYPSDRYHVVIPLGGSSGNGTGDYYININSRSQTYSGSKYMFYATTKKIGGSRWSPINTSQGTTPEQSGAYAVDLGRNYETTIDGNGDSDEFKVTIGANDYDAAGDQLIVYMVNTNGYADQRIWKVWYGSSDLVGKSGGTGPNNVANVYNDIVEYHTYTDFTSMPSGLGQMNWANFRPNYNPNFTGTSGNWNIETLSPDWGMRSMDYFYDYDHIATDTKNKLIEWTEWNFSIPVGGSSPLGIKGLRMDAVKHFDPSFVPNMLNQLYADGITPSIVVGEYYDNNASTLQAWVQSVYNNGFNSSTPIQMHPKVFDFSLREALRNATNNRLSTSDFRYIYTSGLVGGGYLSGNNVVTFLNNHDFRSGYGPNQGDALVHYDPMLAYAYILTNNQLGVPTIYYDDYFGYPATTSPLYKSYFPTTLSPMKCEIDALMALHKQYIYGSPSVTYLNKSGSGYSANYISSSAQKSLIYQLNAPSSTNKRVVVAINFSDDTLKVDHQIGGTATAGTRFTDMLRRSAYPYATVNGSGQIYMQVPPRNYSVWVEGSDEPIVPKPVITTTPAAVEVASVLTATICEGETLNLSGSYVANATTCASMASNVEATYEWTGPDNFTSALQNPTISSITTAKAGDYKLKLKYDCATCTSTEVLVKVIVNPKPTITGATTVIAGSTITLTGSATAASSNAWVSATPSVATVNSSGVVTGVSAGTSVITYTNSNGCSQTTTVTVTAASVKVSPKIMLSGAYNTTTGFMIDSLRSLVDFPTTSPYGGTETIAPSVLTVSTNDAIVDWVKIELRSKTSNTTILHTRSALLQKDGDIVDVDGTSAVTFTNATPDDYYIVIKHRNHLGVMTSAALALSNTSTVVDFTLPSTSTYGTDAQNNVNNVMCLWSGDVIYDNVIKYSGSNNDRLPILQKIGGSNILNTVTGYFNEDVNLDGIVKYSGANNDRLIILQSIGGTNVLSTRTEQVPVSN